MSEVCGLSHEKDACREAKVVQEVVQYEDDQLALKLSGDRGAVVNLETHKYSPTSHLGEGIISTASGNEYYILTSRGRTYIVNTNETLKKGRLVLLCDGYDAESLPPVKLGEPWLVPGFFRTTSVVSVLLKYKVAALGSDVWHKVTGPNPFDSHRMLLKKQENRAR
jgi:hypothetical protein